MEDTLAMIGIMRCSRFVLRRLYESSTVAEACTHLIESCYMIVGSNAVHIEIPALRLTIHEPAEYFAKDRPVRTQALKVPLEVHDCKLGDLTLYFEDSNYVPAEANVIALGITADYLAQLALKTMLASDRISSLTIMERRVFYHLRLRTKEIAVELGIGASTVTSHIKQIYKKLGVSKKVEALSLLEMIG